MALVIVCILIVTIYISVKVAKTLHSVNVARRIGRAVMPRSYRLADSRDRVIVVLNNGDSHKFEHCEVLNSTSNNNLNGSIFVLKG